MRKKGFTIVELISVIVVLTIIILIAVPAYGSIQNSINKKNKENEINLIKVAAEKYAEDYNVTAVFVKDLIDAGYIDPNDGNSIVDPTDKDKNWDCSIVTITKTKDIRTATFNEKSYKSDDSNVCDYNKINDLNGALKIVMSDSKGEITKDTNYWTKENVTLTLKMNDQTISLNNAKITWYKGSQEIQGQNSLSIIVNGIDNSVLTQKYQARVEVDNNTYLALATVQIDRVRPEFYSNDGVKDGVNTDTGWLTETTYKAKAYDTGSGLYGYAIVKDDNETINDCSTQTYTKADSMKITSIGKYTICLRDAAGNVTKHPKRYSLQYIDKTTDTKPELTVVGDNSVNSSWYKGSSVNIKLKSNGLGDSGALYTLKVSDSTTENLLSDNKFGNIYHPEQRTLIEKTYSRTTNGKGITFTGKICTRANKCKEAKKAINYENTWTPGTVSITGDYDSVTATISNSQAISGISSYTYKLINNSTGGVVKTVSKQASLSGATSNKFTGLKNPDSDVTYSVKVVVVTVAGNTSEVKSTNNYTVPGYCLKTKYTKSYGNCTCDKIKTKTVGHVSSYDETLPCSSAKNPVNEYPADESCDLYYKDGTICSNACGGKLNRLAYEYNGGARCSAYDESDTGSNCGGVNWNDSAVTTTGTPPTDRCNGTRTDTYHYKSTLTNQYVCGPYTVNVQYGKTKSSTGECKKKSGVSCPSCSNSGSATVAGTKTTTYKSNIDGTACGSSYNTSADCDYVCSGLPACWTAVDSVSVEYMGEGCNCDGHALNLATVKTKSFDFSGKTTLKYSASAKVSNGADAAIRLEAVYIRDSDSHEVSIFGVNSGSASGTFTIPSDMKKKGKIRFGVYGACKNGKACSPRVPASATFEVQ